VITQRQTILVELIRTAAANPNANDEQVSELVAQKMGLPIDLINEAVQTEKECSECGS